MSELDPDAVDAFIRVADLKSFTRAARALNSTQSAVSLKLRRLEDRLGQRLLERTPRLVRLSPAGETFLPTARVLMSAYRNALSAFESSSNRLVIGISHHVIGSGLPQLLNYIDRSCSKVTLDLRIGSTRELLDRYDDGEFGAVFLVRYEENRREGETVCMEKLSWMASPNFELSGCEGLPLICYSASCKLHAVAASALASAGLHWREVFVGAELASASAAAIAGLGIALISARAAPVGLVDVGGQLGLPEIPPRPLVLHSNVSDPTSRALLQQVARVFRGSTNLS